MIKDGKTIFIQVGLLNTCEYSYLATGTEPSREIHKIPLDVEDWHYYGVEVNPHFISKLLRYKHPKVNLVCAGITGERKLMRVNMRMSRNPNETMQTIAPCMTLNEFIEELMLNHGVQNVGGVYLDIEGAEYDIIMNYEFKYKPDFFGVEVHGCEANPNISKLSYKERGEILKEVFFKNGYRLHHEEVTNDNRTLELQFVLED